MSTPHRRARPHGDPPLHARRHRDADDQDITVETAQNHDGTLHMRWALSGHELTLTNIDPGDYKVSTTITVNGQAAQTTPVTLPPGAGFADPLEAVCVGHGLTLDPGAGFHTTLTRE